MQNGWLHQTLWKTKTLGVKPVRGFFWNLGTLTSVLSRLEREKEAKALPRIAAVLCCPAKAEFILTRLLSWIYC